MNHVLPLAYMTFNVGSDVLYVPQVLKLINHPRSCVGFSLVAWIGWTMTSAVSMIYMVEYAPVTPLLVVAAFNLTCQLSLTSLIVILRLRYRAS